jgi:hypothetical protein
MKFLSKDFDYRSFMQFVIGCDSHSPKTVLEFYNEADDMDIVVDEDKNRVRLTFKSYSEKKALIQGLRFAADVIEGKYYDIYTHEEKIDDS